jgi:hypothetical protein
MDTSQLNIQALIAETEALSWDGSARLIWNLCLWNTQNKLLLG